MQIKTKNIYSQYGEDGIIESILKKIPDSNQWCVEFGAWDGKHLSNTFNLIENKNWHAVLIEGSENRYQDLLKNMANYEKVHTYNGYVGFSDNQNLDVILQKFAIPIDFDFLSIDIDGNDYHVWDAVKLYQPKLVCIEYNPTMSNDVNFIQPADMNISQGCSAKSLVELAKQKSYELVAVTEVNLFFIKESYFLLLGIKDNALPTLRTDRKYITDLFFGYDGTVFTQGNQTLPWHYMKFSQEDFQLLPKSLRDFPENYGKRQKQVYQHFRQHKPDTFNLLSMSYKQLDDFLFSQQKLTYPAMPKDALLNFIKRFRENYIGTDLIRIGGDSDGGYLLPDIFSDIDYCFSPGVDETAFFEKEIADKYGIKSFMLDASVASAPFEHKDFDFEKKFLGSQDRDDVISLSSWMNQKVDQQTDRLILQMDIEDSEYDVLITESIETLSRFRCLIIEFHDWQRMFDKYFLKMVNSLFEKLYKEFTICHVHPNNCSGKSTMHGVEVPQVVEITFIRNDYLETLDSKQKVVLPHPFDRKNCSHKEALNMPAIWWDKRV